MTAVDAYRRLNAARPWLTRQQYRTLVWQIRAGAPGAAMKGLERIIRREKDV